MVKPMLRFIPNILTLTRLLSAIAMLLLINYHQTIFYLFVFASITDWLDGYLAKNFKLASKVGEVLDPIADKMLVISALLILLHYNKSLILLFATAIIIMREFLVSAMRQILVESDAKLKVIFLSKVKATFQMIGIATCLFSLAYANITFFQYGLIFIVISVFLTLYTFLTYVIKSIKILEPSL